MDWTASLSEKLDQLKEMAAKGLIPGHTLHQKMEEAREREKLNTLRSMFAGNDLGESILVDVLGANKGQIKPTIEVLLEITEQRRKQEEDHRMEEETLARIKQEMILRKQREEEQKALEEKNRLEEKLRQDAENTFVGQQISEFVHMPKGSSENLIQLEEDANAYTPKEVIIESPPGSPFIYLKKGSEKEPIEEKEPLESAVEPIPSTSNSPHAGSNNNNLSTPMDVQPTPQTVIPPYHVAFQQSAIPQASAPPFDRMPLDGDSLYSQNLGFFSDDNFFSTSWIPSSSYISGAAKRFFGQEEAPDLLSASVTGTAAKGLRNGLGENNCFLNVVIQSLWHLKAFRNKFLESNTHSHSAKNKEESCPYCALKIIFAQYQFGEESALPPNILRNALSVLHKAESKFQLGTMSDAAEAHDALLRGLHDSITGGDEKIESFIHRVFALHVIEYMKCECGKPQKPFPCKQFYFYAAAKALRQQASEHLQGTSSGELKYGITLGPAIKKINHEDLRPCANEQCKRMTNLRFALANLPEVLSIGIVWDISNPGVDYIWEVMNLIDHTVKVEDMFDSVVQPGTYILRGMITYYGLHYNAYFRNPKTNEWLVFDDARVNKVGPTWQDVVAKCLSGRWQPSVLWYEYVSS